MHGVALEECRRSLPTLRSSARDDLLSALGVDEPCAPSTRLRLNSHRGAAQVRDHQHRASLALVVDLTSHRRVGSQHRVPARGPRLLDAFDFDAGKHEMTGALWDQ